MSDEEAKARLKVTAVGVALIVSGGVAWDLWAMRFTAVGLVVTGALLFMAAQSKPEGDDE
jgi:hypothetical protein